MSEKTQEQKRAGHALKCVGAVKVEAVKTETFAARYRSYAESLPTHIVMSGLGQAVATELAAARLGEAKRDDGHRAHERLAGDLESWLGQTVYASKDKRPAGWLIQTIMDNPQKDYLRAQAEALAWLMWLKKLCQASLPKAAEE